MEKEIVFSVIVPTYNRSAFLSKTIDSVLAQQYKNFELIIVNDGSTDSTDDVIHTFHDQRIRYFKKENAERAAARNFGTQKATGDYVTFLDSDDLIDENHLSSALVHIQQEQPPVFHLGYNIVDAEDKVIYAWRKLEDPVNRVLIEGNALSCLGIFIERKLALKNLFNEDRNLAGSEDYELWLRVAARYPFRAYPEVTAKLVNHDSRSVLGFDPEKLTKRIKLLRHYLKEDIPFMKAYGHKLKRLDGLLDIYVALHLAMLPGSKVQAIKVMIDSFRNFPAVIFYRRFWAVVKKVLIS